MLYIYIGSRGSVVGIATAHGLVDRGIRALVSVGQEFLLLHIVNTDFEVHSSSYSMGTGTLSKGVKRQGREADHSPLTNAAVREKWIYTPTPPYAFMA
jgi:hypothetical protein